jgi:ERCC4-related helicase
MLSSEREVLTVNPDELLDVYTYLRGCLSQKESEWFSSNPLLRNTLKCVYLKENDVPHGKMKKVAELVKRAWQQYIH